MTIKKLLAVIFLVFLSGGIILSGCTRQESSYVTGKYTISPVDLKDVKLTDRFWLPIIRRVATV